MRFKHHSVAEDSASIDLTPLMDVVFILLIFFILSASFQQTRAIQVERPQSQVNDISSTVSLMVSIDKNGDIWFDQQTIDINMLAMRVKQKVAGAGITSAIIQVDKQGSSGRLIEVVDKIRIAGVDNVAVATDQAS